jgi:hypothetical protein
MESLAKWWYNWKDEEHFSKWSVKFFEKKKKTSRIRDSWFPTFQWSEDSHGLRDVLKSQFDPWNALLQQFLSVFYCYVVAIACVFSCKLFLLCRSISFTFLLKWKAILLCNTNFSH